MKDAELRGYFNLLAKLATDRNQKLEKMIGQLAQLDRNSPNEAKWLTWKYSVPTHEPYATSTAKDSWPQVPKDSAAWDCQRCHRRNLWYRTCCYNCKTPRAIDPKTEKKDEGDPEPPQIDWSWGPGDWEYCPRCGGMLHRKGAWGCGQCGQKFQ